MSDVFEIQEYIQLLGAGMFEEMPLLKTPMYDDPAVMLAQKLLNKHGAVPQLNVDGDYGGLSVQATRAFQRSRGLQVDGKIWKGTWEALWADPDDDGDDIEPLIVPATPSGLWTPFDGQMERQPRNRAEVIEIFGNPVDSDGNQDDAWVKRNIIYCKDGGGHRPSLPGVPSKWWFAIHKDVEPYLREALTRAMQTSAYAQTIERAGGFNIRGSASDKTKLSFHSYGIAVDFDPKRNKAVRFKRGEAPEAWSEAWNKIWPPGITIDKAFVDAFRSCGFAWGADWDEDNSTSDHTYMDTMHVEWVARDGDNQSV